MLGEMTVSMLKGENGFQRKEVFKFIEWLRQESPPDVVSLPYSLLIGLSKPIKELLGRPVCCTLQGEDLFLEGLHEPYKSESLDLIRANVKHVDAFIAVSQYYADFMPDYLGIPAEKIHVVPLGINMQGYEQRKPDTDKIFTIGFFARVAPEKGLHVLAEAYRKLRAAERIPKARLEAAGYIAPEHQGYLREIEQQMTASGFESEFNYRGVLDRDEKIAFLRKLDVMSVPATYDEPKGIFLLEAMACGVPVVQPRRGAFTEIVENTGGGLLVEPDSPEAIAAAIQRLFDEPELGARLSESGFRKVREQYTVAQTADRALELWSAVASAARHKVLSIDG
jgi:glycosyltransferase involved in cell wall biosynthesis